MIIPPTIGAAIPSIVTRTNRYFPFILPSAQRFFIAREQMSGTIDQGRCEPG